MTRAAARCRCSGGKSRVGGPAAEDADGALELDPVWVDVRFGGSLTDQGTDRVVGQQVAVDLLPHQIRGLRAQYPPGPAQVRLELPVSGFVLPPFVVCVRQR